MALQAGDTFKAADRSIELHVWVILSDPGNHPGYPVLIANLTSWRDGKDGACVLKRGDHPLVSRKTCMNYRDSKLVQAEKLEAALAQGLLVPCKPVSARVLRRMRDGAAISRFIPLGNLQLLKDQGIVE